MISNVKSILLLLGLSCSIFGKDYLGAELYSRNTVKYGRFEIRMMAANGSGTLSTFFTYYNESYAGLPENWREIDLEILGKSTNSFQSNIITGHAADKKTSEEIHTLSADLTNDFHTYIVEWTPDYIAWFFDGQELRRTTGGQVAECQDKEQSYRFNTWISSIPSWVGNFNPGILPIYQYINWIKFYRYSPGAGEGGSDFSFSWEDNFDSFDSGRWSRADWTFDENLVDFSPNNVVVRDGTMILCLTSANAPGFSGIVPNDEPTSVLFGDKNNLPDLGEKKIIRLDPKRGGIDLSLNKYFSLDGKILDASQVIQRNSFNPVITTVKD